MERGLRRIQAIACVEVLAKRWLTCTLKPMTYAPYFPYEPATVDYLTHISDERRYFYFSNPKVCSTTILAVLQSAETGQDVPAKIETVHDRAKSPLKNISTTAELMYQLFETPRYFRFTYVRNPYTRVLSAYLHKVVGEPWARAEFMPQLGLYPAKEIGFAEFLRAVRDQADIARDIHWRTQAGLIQPRLVKYDFIGRFESFAASFESVIERCNAMTQKAAIRFLDQEYSMAAAHATDASAKLKHYLGPEERDLIGLIYADDFNTFGYGYDPAFAHV